MGLSNWPGLRVSLGACVECGRAWSTVNHLCDGCRGALCRKIHDREDLGAEGLGYEDPTSVYYDSRAGRPIGVRSTYGAYDGSLQDRDAFAQGDNNE